MDSIDPVPSSATPQAPALTRAIVVIAVSVFHNFTGFTLILPVIPFLWLRRNVRWLL